MALIISYGSDMLHTWGEEMTGVSINLHNEEIRDLYYLLNIIRASKAKQRGWNQQDSVGMEKWEIHKNAIRKASRKKITWET